MIPATDGIAENPVDGPVIPQAGLSGDDIAVAR